jgi:TetR/AcrR family transcriptional regulator, regulator of cefoperazone and chloramphenicol sensitivity
VSSEDLTARARIREAAIDLFAERGIGPATIRDIAERAGVSSGLLRHHFGSKEGLRDACDEYAMSRMNELRDRLMGPNAQVDPAVLGAMNPSALRLQVYLVKSMMEGSSNLLFDAAMESGRTWAAHADIETEDLEAWLATMIALKIGLFVMRDQVGRVLGDDMSTAKGFRRMVRASIEIFSRPIVTPEQADQALKALDSLYPIEE